MRLAILCIVFVACSSRPAIRADDDAAEQPTRGDKSGTRLKVRYYVGADGSEQAIGFYDTVRKENCTFAVAADGVLRCLPEVAPQFASFTRYFSDARCTQELAEVPTGCHATYTAKATSATACSSGSRVFSLGPIFNGQIYVDNAFGCARGSSTSHHDYYAMSAEIAPTSFQNATEVVR